MEQLKQAVLITLAICFFLVPSCPARAADEGDSCKARFLPEPIFGGQVYLYEAGQANAEILLLIHGIGDNAGRSWGRVLSESAQRFHVVVPDLPGFGRSTAGNHLYSPDAYAAFLDWLISALPEKPIHLVGHSLGGAVALVYAAQNRHPLKRLVLVDSVGLLHYLAVSQNFVQRMALDRFLIPPLRGPLGKVTDLLLEKTSRIPFDPDFLLSTAFLRQKFLAADPVRIAALALVQTDYSLLLDQVDVPTWLIWGEQDDIAPLRIARILEWRLPRVRLLTMPGGHVPMATDPVAFSALLSQALTGLPAENKRPKTVRGRTGRCHGGSGQVFSGDYKEIQIQSCQNVLLTDVRARKLVVRDSSVEVECSILGDDQSAGPAIEVTGSKLTMTGADIISAKGIVTEQSRLDLAGVHFTGTGRAISAQGNPSSLLCSSSTRIDGERLVPLHLSRSLDAGESL